MKVLVLLALGSLLASCGSGTAATIPAAEACGQISTTACAKVFESTCVDSASLLVRAVIKSQAECETTVIQGYCASVQSLCPVGYTYHGDKAATCKDAISKQPCATFNSTLLAAAVAGSGAQAIASLSASFPVCGEVCTAP